MENKKDTTKDKKNKSIKIRTIAVLVSILVFVLLTAISIRGQYLRVIEISEEYVQVFYKNLQNRYTVFGVSFLVIYVAIYITNKFIKKGLSSFFEDEKKKIPKLPNKSICIIVALLGGFIISNT